MAKPAMPFSEDGRKFIKLLEKAAGVEGKRVHSIECRVSMREPIHFKVELSAIEDDLKRAVSECEVTKLGDAFVEVATCADASH